MFHECTKADGVFHYQLLPNNDYLNTCRYHLTCQFVKELRTDRETLTDDELRAVSWY